VQVHLPILRQTEIQEVQDGDHASTARQTEIENRESGVGARRAGPGEASEVGFVRLELQWPSQIDEGIDAGMEEGRESASAV
jgi:hypothetical protein